MSNSPRDTQFRGFAKALLDELCLASDVHIETPFNDDWREEWEETIAQRAYDLVEHTIEHMKPYIYGEQVAGQESVSDVLDMTELPKED